MPEYAKMKNADLEALLKERGLPSTGKKADMVDRLVKDDEKNSASAEAKAAVNAEDEIDWDDDGDEAAATTAPVTSNEETIENAGGEGQPPNPQAVPNQIADIDPAQTDDLTVQPPAEGSADAAVEEKKEPAPDYSKGLAATNLDEEIERRRKRAEKFGLKVEDDEGLKKLERAKKFGESAPPRGLDEALPERNRKRTREGGDDAGDNKRRGGGRSGGRGGRGGRDRRDNRDTRDNRDNRDNRETRGRSDREPRKEQARSNNGGTWMSEKDRAAAEARKAKWANSAAS
jgi:SAP domain-containing ribonucleoprotein